MWNKQTDNLSSDASAANIANQINPNSKQLYYAKGSYYSCTSFPFSSPSVCPALTLFSLSHLIDRGPGTSSISHLLYPCPDPTSLAGLGTHLTLSLSKEIRFGPDVEWLPAPLLDVEDGNGGMCKEEEADFWMRHLAVEEGQDGERRKEFVRSVRDWLPGVSEDGFSPDCTYLLSPFSSFSS